ncbi:MAG: hypothetical protein ACKO6I_10990, partial [Sphingomonadales bacterium]
YVISVHDINFHDKEYTARFWIWFVYSNPKLDFTKQLDIPNSKAVEQAFPIHDSIEGKAWVMMKMKAFLVMVLTLPPLVWITLKGQQILLANKWA